LHGDRERRGGGVPKPGAGMHVKCAICSQTWSADTIRQHMGFHILHERQKVTAVLPCGFCGGESAQYSTDFTQVPGCAVWIEKKQPKMHCKLVGGDMKYSMAAAKKSTTAAPCTNVPMLCPTCPQPGRRRNGVVHWKLNMLAHYGRSHRSIEVPPSLKEQVQTSETERSWVKTVGGDRLKVKK
jgi:hypothetical protein